MLPYLEWEEKSPPSAGIDQLIPPPRPLGLRSTDGVVKDVTVGDLDLAGGEVRVEAFSVMGEVDEGRRLLLTPLSLTLIVTFSFSLRSDSLATGCVQFHPSCSLSCLYEINPSLSLDKFCKSGSGQTQ